MDETTPRAVYRVEEVMRMLDMGRTAVYEAIRRGDLPSVKIGRRVLVPKPALDRLLQADAA